MSDPTPSPSNPKPYTTPEGYKAPAMKELWLYVSPYLSTALLFGRVSDDQEPLAHTPHGR